EPHPAALARADDYSHYFGDLPPITGPIYDQGMPLESVIVSRDWQEVSVLECILNSLQIGVTVHQDVASAREKLSKAKIDALILDRDLGGTESVLARLPVNGSSTPCILMSRSAEQHDLPASGATFFFEKPISVEQAVKTLSAARNVMITGRVRYHRHELHVPVDIRCGKQRRMTAELTNLSYGGLGIRAAHSLASHGPVTVRFKVPGLNRVIAAEGELAWADNRGHAGIRFVQVPAHLQQSVQHWLSRRYFAS
ncbi:MAG TPA: PilZ domain-containing protein, partial [Terriglobales bacterium]|nr:PilZ domain-containing protein [Terriglobales bacterium]